MPGYPFQEIEAKWQAYWEEHATFRAVEDPDIPEAQARLRPGHVPLPVSGAGLHVGHPEGYTATDIYCRYLRMKGYNVLHPMGYDSFGLPAENYAIKTGIHPADYHGANIAHFQQADQDVWASPTTGRAAVHHTTRTTTAGRSGSS